jgi:hypothetical protein
MFVVAARAVSGSTMGGADWRQEISTTEGEFCYIASKFEGAFRRILIRARHPTATPELV